MQQSNLRVPIRHSNILRRPRLLDILHTNIHRKLSFVCASAGYGKTTLLVDFAEDVDAEIIWYRILDSDQNLFIFYTNIIRAFRQKKADFGEDLLQDIQTSAPSPKILAQNIIEEIEDKINEYSLLVLDDFHVISKELEINEFMDHLFDFLPEQLRILIGSRNVYGIPTASLYIQEQITIINDTDLSFRPDELQNLCHQYYQIQLTLLQAEKIIEESEGWIIAILLALRTNQSSIEIPKILGAKEHIYTFLAKEVVNSLPQNIKQFMAATSLVDEFNAEFANHLLAINNSQEIIKEIEHLNLFLTDSSIDGSPSYRYHQLFSEFLRSHFDDLSDKEIFEFHEQAANWYQTLNDPEKAISHFISSGNKISAAQIINKYAHEYYINGQILTLESWYQELLEPEDFRHLAPNLLLSLAKARNSQSEYSKVEELLTLAEAIFVRTKSHNNYANLLITRGMLNHFTGNHKKAFEIAGNTQILVDEHGIDRTYYYQAERLKGISSHHLGNTQDAFKYLNNAASAFRKDINTNPIKDNILDLIMTLSDIGYLAIGDGKMFEAQSSFHEAVEFSMKIRGNYSGIAMTSNNFAYLHYLLGNYSDAWGYYMQAMEAADAHELEKHKVYIMNGQADILLAVGEIDEAQETYQKSLALAEKIGESTAMVDSFSGMSEIESINENFNKAIFYIRETARINNEDIKLDKYQSKLAKVYMAMGQIELAEETYINILNDWGNQPESQQLQAETYFHYAIIQYLLKNYKNTNTFVQKAFAVSTSLGYDQFLINITNKHLDFTKFLSKNQDSPQIRSFLSRVNEPSFEKGQVRKKAEDTQSFETNLQVTTFGNGEVRLNGEIIQNHKWQSAGAKAMFFLLIDQEKVRKEQIALEFWPDFSPGKINSNFHATLWRVRNALGGKHMIEYKNNYYQINSTIMLHSDIKQYEKTLKGIKKSSSETKLRSLLREAVELYQEDYMLDIDMTWADNRRTQIQVEHIKILKRLANIEFEKNAIEKSLELFNRLIQIEPFDDSNHLNAMKCMVSLGRNNEAIQLYKKYSIELKEELDINAGEKIQNFYNSIKQ